MKNRWVAAILNFVTLGLGTAFLGRRVIFGVLLTLGGAFLRYEELRIAPAVTGTVSIHWVWAFIGMGLVGVATAVDGYREANALAKTSS
jgi:hypothetical protein